MSSSEVIGTQTADTLRSVAAEYARTGPGVREPIPGVHAFAGIYLSDPDGEFDTQITPNLFGRMFNGRPISLGVASLTLKVYSPNGGLRFGADIELGVGDQLPAIVNPHISCQKDWDTVWLADRYDKDGRPLRQDEGKGLIVDLHASSLFTAYQPSRLSLFWELAKQRVLAKTLVIPKVLR